MSAVGADRVRRRRGLLRLRQENMESLFGYAYAILMTDLLLVLANLPLAALLFVARDALQAWPAVLLLSLTLAPSLAGAFEVFRSLRGEEEPAGPSDRTQDHALQMQDRGPRHAEDAAGSGGSRPPRPAFGSTPPAFGSPAPFAAFWAGYRRRGPAAALVGFATALVIGFVLYDGAILTGAWGALLAPTLAVVAAWTLATCTSAVAGLVLYPQASVRAILKAAVYLSVRRWYFSVFALVLLGLAAAAVIAQPVLGALVPALLLYVVFANAEFGFRRAVEAGASAAG